jgi:hypothetical protein
MWIIEITDTFAGEANYSWVIRRTINKPLKNRDAVRRAIMHIVEETLGGWQGRCTVAQWTGDYMEVRPPKGYCHVAFAIWDEFAQQSI